MAELPWLTLLVFAPWLGALSVMLVSERRSRWVAPAVAAVPLVLGLGLLAAHDPARTIWRVEEAAWIPGLHVRYILAVDALSLLMILLTGLVTPACLLAPGAEPGERRLLRALFLFLEGSALGVFVAQEFFLWFLFWELSLVPAFFLIKLWGGPGASRAAYQFFVYTMGGSALMLLGFAAIYAAGGGAAFLEVDGRALEAGLATLGGDGRFLGLPWGALAFFGVLLGLAVKAPLFPFHTWLPAAYAEAPTGVTMFLTAVMSKMGVYGFLRILAPFFPGHLQAAAPVLLWLALGGAVLGALAALRQRDLKRMLAYSSFNHVSYCLLGFFALHGPEVTTAPLASIGRETGSGILLQMFNHGVTAAALFFFVGVLEERAGRRGSDDFGGVRTGAPMLAGLCGIALFSAIGLPGLNGFVSELLIFRGVFAVAPTVAALACIGLFATAAFLLVFYQRVFHGPATGNGVAVRDLTGIEIAVVGPAIALIIALGVHPQLLLGWIGRWAGIFAGS